MEWVSVGVIAFGCVVLVIRVVKEIKRGREENEANTKTEGGFSPEGIRGKG